MAEGEVTEVVKEDMCVGGESGRSNVSEDVLGMESGWRCGIDGEGGLKIGDVIDGCERRKALCECRS